MNLYTDVQVGERYEVQPQQCHRGFIGKVKRVAGQTILFKVENYDICDRDQVAEDHLVEANRLDIKYLIKPSCFFS